MFWEIHEVRKGLWAFILDCAFWILIGWAEKLQSHDREWNPPTGQVCTVDWLEFQGSCYRRFEERRTWHQARNACRDLEGDLVALTTSSIQEFVYKNLAIGRTLWIGLVQNEKVHRYVTERQFGLLWFLDVNFPLLTWNVLIKIILVHHCALKLSKV